MWARGLATSVPLPLMDSHARCTGTGWGNAIGVKSFLLKSCLLQVRYHLFVMFICIAEECGLLADS